MCDNCDKGGRMSDCEGWKTKEEKIECECNCHKFSFPKAKKEFKVTSCGYCKINHNE